MSSPARSLAKRNTCTAPYRLKNQILNLIQSSVFKRLKLSRPKKENVVNTRITLTKNLITYPILYSIAPNDTAVAMSLCFLCLFPVRLLTMYTPEGCKSIVHTNVGYRSIVTAFHYPLHHEFMNTICYT